MFERVLREFCHLPEVEKNEADLHFHILAGSLFELWLDICPGTLDQETAYYPPLPTAYY
ncbi:hypothetical protein [Baia soyae]|uniref:hypothetical protein n=1 Tax=Baia soyae TaxID=1544746 RepID=UPI0014042784|nr:hypothetical protein [Baia soyae]